MTLSAPSGNIKLVRLPAAAASFLALGSLAARARPMLAQCPDGTPPPCRAAAPATTRRANPPLDDRTWIVLPFENVSRATEIDWLREASVNLLYLDMSKWRDIRVIDDERVADLLREVPEARGGQQLTLQTGTAVARRAGAGRLVMGDLLRLGNRTRIVAKVFDVRTGQRVRNVIEETASPDSLMPMFGRLARGVLNAEPPSEAALGTVGTARLDAYQEYLAGVRALNAFNTTEARGRFEHALELDSSFALAHYKLSIVLGWVNPTDPARRAHAEAAARLAGALPNRVRALIAAQAQASASDYARACETLAPLVRADSNDVETLYNFGECTYHDAGVVPVPGDTSRFMFRSSWNTALRSFRRVLALDPSYHLAFQHIQDTYQASTRTGCLLQPSGMAACMRQSDVFASGLIRVGDTLVTVPVRASDASALTQQMAEAARTGTRRRNLEEARRAAEEWVSAGPAEPRARAAYGTALLRLGRVEEAEAAFRQITGGQSQAEAATVAVDRFEALLKLGRAADAIHLADSVMLVLDTMPQQARGVALVLRIILGRMAGLDSMIAARVQAPPPVLRYVGAAARTLLGVPADSLYQTEAAFAQLVAAAQGRERTPSSIGPTLVWSFRSRRPDQWSLFDTASADRQIAVVSHLASGDTAGFRRALAVFDSVNAGRRDEPDVGNSLLSAEAHLTLGDTAAALRELRAFRDVTWRNTALLEPMSGFPVGWLWPRSFLLLGDLAAASGQGAEAREAYRRFVELWQTASGEARPQLERARAALAQLGS